MLSALADHRERFVGADGANVYAEAAGVWARIAHDLAGSADTRAASGPAVH